MFEKILTKTLNPILSNLGSGWKSAIGLIGLATAATLLQLGVIESDTATTVQRWAEILFAVGVFHKVTKDG